MKSSTCKLIMIIVALLVFHETSLGQRTVSNPHDFSTDNWDLTARCDPCHALNEEEQSSGDNFFAIDYESDSLQLADSAYISSTSKLCYTCHDGSVASFSHTSGATELNSSSSTMNNHPVSIVYAVKKTGKKRLYDPQSTMSGLGGTIANDLLKNGRVECTSCHDAHFSTEKIACSSCPQVFFTSGSSDGSSSLWMENNKSALCLTCHKL